jgi:integrase
VSGERSSSSAIRSGAERSSAAPETAADISEDDVLHFSAEVEAAGCSAGTARKALVVLSGVLGYAARRGMFATNPVTLLERGEMRILDRGGIARLLDAASPNYQPLLATVVFTGLRLGELLGLFGRRPRARSVPSS